MRRKTKGTWGGRREGAGGKPKPPGERRDYPILVRLNVAERALIEAAAGETPLGTWLRELGLRAARRRGMRGVR